MMNKWLNRFDPSWRSLVCATLGGLSVHGCASSPASTPVLDGVYVATSTEGPNEEIGFLDGSHYFLESEQCAQKGGDCIESGTYTLTEGTLSLTDDSTGAVSSMPLSITGTVSDQSAEGLHLLGGLGGSAGTDAGVSVSTGMGSNLTSGTGVSLGSLVQSMLLNGQTFLVWGASGLSGNFASRICESLPDGTYELRKYSFSASGATAEWDRFSDPLCSAGSKLASIVIVGSAKVAGLSSQVFGAANLIVSMSQKTITPTMSGLATVGSECTGYAWQADTSQVVTTGCGTLLQQTEECAAEYDLMKLTSDGLVFGDRSHPLCTADTRPTALSEWAVVPGSGYQSPGDTNSADASTP